MLMMFGDARQHFTCSYSSNCNSRWCTGGWMHPLPPQRFLLWPSAPDTLSFPSAIPTSRPSARPPLRLRSERSNLPYHDFISFQAKQPSPTQRAESREQRAEKRMNDKFNIHIHIHIHGRLTKVSEKERGKGGKISHQTCLFWQSGNR